eukprot:scaffold13062_cov109-Skeletonema_dohrnii-CCMP3373.AAC.3
MAPLSHLPSFLQYPVGLARQSPKSIGPRHLRQHQDPIKTTDLLTLTHKHARNDLRYWDPHPFSCKQSCALRPRQKAKTKPLLRRLDRTSQMLLYLLYYHGQL